MANASISQISSLVPVNAEQIGNELTQTVNARELHNWLGCKQRFNDWIKKRIQDYRFAEGVDYVRINLAPSQKMAGHGNKIDEIVDTPKNVALESTGCGDFGQQGRIEYAVTLDMAKELAMVERNEKGREARHYFIECEKQLRAGNAYTMLPASQQALRLAEDALHAAKIFGFEGNFAKLSANNAIRAFTGINLLEAFGAELESEKQERLMTPTEIGKILELKRNGANPLLIAAGLQTSDRDHNDKLVYEPTEIGKRYSTYVDTGKKHKTDGAPVQQLKWYASVLGVLREHISAEKLNNLIG